MNQVMNAEDLLASMEAMPPGERRRFWNLLGAQILGIESLSHEQVFGHLMDARFSTQEAADYLEVSKTSLSRYVRQGRLNPSRNQGRKLAFDVVELKAFKRSLRNDVKETTVSERPGGGLCDQAEDAAEPRNAPCVLSSGRS